MALLSTRDVEQKLNSLPDWKLIGGEIVCELKFIDFVAAIDFVNRVAEKAEASGHHPDIDIRYNRLRLALISHDAGGLTQSDFDLAAALSDLPRDSDL